MKTTHQLAKELNAMADMPIWHFDPSLAGQSEEDDASLTVPRVQVNKSVTQPQFATIFAAESTLLQCTCRNPRDENFDCPVHSGHRHPEKRRADIAVGIAEQLKQQLSALQEVHRAVHGDFTMACLVFPSIAARFDLIEKDNDRMKEILSRQSVTEGKKLLP